MFSKRIRFLLWFFSLNLLHCSANAALETPGNLILGLRIDGDQKNFLLDLGAASSMSDGFTVDLSSSPFIGDIWGSSWITNNLILWNVVGSHHNNNWDAAAGAYVDPNAGKFYIGFSGNPPLASKDGIPGGNTTLQELAGGFLGMVNATSDAVKTSIGSSQLVYTSYLDNSWGATQPKWGGALGGRSEFGYVDNPTLSLYSFFYSPDDFDTPAAPNRLGAFTFTNGFISFSTATGDGSSGGVSNSYTGPWNWTASSGNWSVTNNWTSNQVASNGYAVGITGAGGTITNDSVTSLSSITFSNTAGSSTLTGTNSGQTLTISGGITNNSAATQTIDISIGGDGGVTQSGSGTTVLARSNSYSGATTLSSGAVVLGNNNALGTGALTVSGASSLIAGVANLFTTNAMALNAATTINTEANRWTNAGTLSGSGSLTKVGSGTLTIAGSGSTFNGNTALNAGALQVAPGSSLGSGTVTIASGSSLSGSGTVGGVSFSSGGILTGGVDGAVGKLTVIGNMQFSAGGILNWKLADATGAAGTGFDSFDVRGTLDLTGLTTGSTLQFNILNAAGGTVNFLNNQNSQWLVAASTNSIQVFSTNDFTISTRGFTNALGGGAFGFITNATGLYLKFTALGVDPWTGNLAAGSNVISGQTIASASNSVIGANSSRNGSVAVTNNGVWNVNGGLQVGGSTNGNGTLTIGSGGRVTANELKISDQRGSKGLVLITNGASSNPISIGSGTVSFGAGNGTLQFAQNNAVTITNAVSGKGMISSTGTGTTTLSGNQAGFSGTNYLSSGKVVLGSGVTNGGILNIAGRGTNVVFEMKAGSVLSSTNTHAVAGLLSDNSGKAFNDAIKGKVVLAPTGILQKTYTNGQSVAGFGAGIGARKSFSLLAGSVANPATLEAKVTAGALDFKGTYSNNIVMAITDPSFSAIRNTIQWYDPATKTWKNTVVGNIGGSNKIAAISGMNGKSFVGSFSTFLLQAKTAGILTAAEDTLDEINAMAGNQINLILAKIMGAFGYDNKTKTSWAVINHNSLYSGEDLGSSEIFDEAALNHTLSDPSLVSTDPNASVMTAQAVPEPGTWTLMLAGGVLLFLAGRSKRRGRV
jgi:autotransporter-associated beta strand protein